VTAIVGSTGAGKTTLLNLLPRFYDVTGGRVLVDGVDVRSLKRTDLWARIGLVPQKAFLFSGTVARNLRFGDQEATDAELWTALQIAQARDFVASMEGGLEAPIGQGGATVSGGQRQRLAIARALLSDPQCFIFDEATSALDTLSEQLIQEALNRNLAGRTVIFIAHRLATVKHCDRILVIADGRVTQDGSYSELVAQPGLFQDLVHGQSLRE
jgi:ATP-binding cassette subfamily B protein